MSGNAIAPGMLASLGRSSSAICCCLRGALLPRLQPQDRVAVDHGREAGEGGEGGGLGHRRVELLDRPHHVAGELRRRSLRRGHDAEDDAAVLDRRQLGLQRHEEHGAQADDARPGRDDDPAVAQRGREQPAVAVGHRDQARLDHVVDPRVLRLVLEQQRAHHRRERQRDEARHEHRAGERERELDEEPAGASGRERQRREHRRERERHREHGEGDLARSLDRRLLRRYALLDVPEDVLQHHDRVVDDEPDREHHRRAASAC